MFYIWFKERQGDSCSESADWVSQTWNKVSDLLTCSVLCPDPSLLTGQVLKDHHVTNGSLYLKLPTHFIAGKLSNSQFLEQEKSKPQRKRNIMVNERLGKKTQVLPGCSILYRNQTQSVLFCEMHSVTQGNSKQYLFRTTTWKAWRRISDYQKDCNKGQQSSITKKGWQIQQEQWKHVRG